MSSSKKILGILLFINSFFSFLMPSEELDLNSFRYSSGITDVYAANWHPSGDYLAVCGYWASESNVVEVYSFDKQTNTLSTAPITQYRYTLDIRTTVYDVQWSPDGNYLALAGINPGDAGEFIILAFASENLTYKTAIDISSGYCYKIAWHPNGTYIATVFFSAGSSDGVAVYSYDGATTLTLEDSKAYSTLRSVAWHPSGNYLAIAGSTGNPYSVYIYSFNFSTGNLSTNPIDQKKIGSTAYGLAFNNNGRYLAVSVNAADNAYPLQLFSFDGGYLSADSICSREYGGALYRLNWSHDDRYITICSTNGNADKIYSFDKRLGLFSDVPIASVATTADPYGAVFSNDSRFFAACGGSNFIATDFSYFKGLGLTRYDGTKYNVNLDDHVILRHGDNAKANVWFNNGITVAELAEVYLDIDGSINGPVDLRDSGNLILGNDLTFDSNVTFSSGGIIDGSGNTIFLNSNLTIPEDSVIRLTSDTIIDGQGYDLTLNKRSNLVLEAGVTLTLRNLKIKNRYNTQLNPLIKCLGWDSQLCLQDVCFELMNDFQFLNGQMFIHNDVEITGTAKFSYKSFLPAYITKNSNLIVSPQATLEYAPGTIDNTLIKMHDETSRIYLDGATLQTTHTGLRLTEGQVYLDNGVTFSTKNMTFSTLDTNYFSANLSSDVNSVDWHPTGKYLAVGKQTSGGGSEVIVYSCDGISLTSIWTASPLLDVNQVKWSPDGKYLAYVTEQKTGGDELLIYSFDGSSFSFVDGANPNVNTQCVEWRNDGRYIAFGTNDGGSANVFYVYSFDGLSISYVDSVSFTSISIYSLSWYPTGEYISVGAEIKGGNEVLMYYFLGGESLINVGGIELDITVRSIKWNHDGRYIAIGTEARTGDDFLVYSFDGSNFTFVDGVDIGGDVFSVDWSCDSGYVAIGTAPRTGNEVILYSFENETLTEVGGVDLGTGILDIKWGVNSDYLAFGTVSNYLRVYPVLYNFDSTYQKYENGIIFGDYLSGSNYDLDVYFNAGSKLNLYGTLWEDSYNTINFINRGSGIYLSSYDSKFKITNEDSLTGWNQNYIFKEVPENTLFLKENQIWGTFEGEWLPPQESFDLINDLIIPDNQIIHITSDIAIDGKDNNLILGHGSHFLLDSGVTLTLKNTKLKNSLLNKISPYPFQVTSDDNKIALKNVVLGLNGNISFTKGSLFFHDNVKITGTTEFIYSSSSPSFIVDQSCLYFNNETSLYYNQNGVSTNMELIVMQDETSNLYLDGATLKTTDTGLRLTKGRLFLDNKVTLSGYSKVPQAYSNGIIFGNSELGSEYNLDVNILAAANLEVFGNVWLDNY